MNIKKMTLLLSILFSSPVHSIDPASLTAVVGISVGCSIPIAGMIFFAVHKQCCSPFKECGDSLCDKMHDTLEHCCPLFKAPNPNEHTPFLLIQEQVQSQQMETVSSQR